MPDSIAPSTHPGILIVTLLGIAALVYLISRWKLHPFLALTLCSLAVAVGCGLSPLQAVSSYEKGLGKMLQAITPIIAFGALLGKRIERAGAAGEISRFLLGKQADQWIYAKLFLLGFIVGLPVFFSVGLIVLAPVLVGLSQDTKLPLANLGIALVAGLSAAHGLVPPHPGPMAAIAVLHANPGTTLLYSIVIAFPAGAASLWLVRKWLPVSLGQDGAKVGAVPPVSASRVSLGVSLLTLLLPIALILTGAFLPLAPNLLSPLAKGALLFFSNSTVALLCAVFLSFYTLGINCGFTGRELLIDSEQALASVSALILIVGAGGGLNQVLLDAGVGTEVANLASRFHLSLLLLGWCIAACIRVATGSATVAINAAAGLLAPAVAAQSQVRPELVVIAMGAGSLILSHVNDGGFWLVKEYLGLSLKEAFRSWTLLETFISITGLLLVLLAAIFI